MNIINLYAPRHIHYCTYFNEKCVYSSSWHHAFLFRYCYYKWSSFLVRSIIWQQYYCFLLDEVCGTPLLLMLVFVPMRRLGGVCVCVCVCVCVHGQQSRVPVFDCNIVLFMCLTCQNGNILFVSK